MADSHLSSGPAHRDQRTAIVISTAVGMISDRSCPWYKLFCHVQKHSKTCNFAEATTQEGHTVLHVCVINKRLSHIDALQKLGLLQRLIDIKVPPDFNSPFPNCTALEITRKNNSPKLMGELQRLLDVENSMTEVHKCARSGDHQRLISLIQKRRVDINRKDKADFSVLHWACVSGTLECVKQLISAGLSVTATTNQGLTPLHIASKYGCSAVVDYLLGQPGVKPAERDRTNRTPFEYTAMNGDKDTSDVLFRANVKPDTIVIILASYLGHEQYLDHAITVYKVSVDSRDKEGRTCLMVASEQGHIHITKLLLTKFRFKMDDTNFQGRNLFHLSAKSSSRELVLLLLERAREQGLLPDVLNVKDKHMVSQWFVTLRGVDNGRAGWHQIHKYRRMEPWLRKATVYGTVDGRKAGTIVCSGWGEQPPADILNHNVTDYIRDNAHRLTEDQPDMSPLQIATLYNNQTVAELYVREGADVNAKDCFQLTPLHLAAAHGNMELASILIDKGANLDAKDVDGKSPLAVAMESEQHQIASLLNSDADIVLARQLTSCLLDRISKLNRHELLQMKVSGQDVRRYIIDVARDAYNDVTHSLVDLGSGPIVAPSDDQDP